MVLLIAGSDGLVKAIDTDEEYDYTAPYFTIDPETGELVQIDPSKSETSSETEQNSTDEYKAFQLIALLGTVVGLGVLGFLARNVWHKRS